MIIQSLHPLPPIVLELLGLVMDEVDYALAKHGDHPRTLAEWLLIIEAELAEAKHASIKSTKVNVGHELRQVAACAILALIQSDLSPKRDWNDSPGAIGHVISCHGSSDNPAVRVFHEDDPVQKGI